MAFIFVAFRLAARWSVSFAASFCFSGFWSISQFLIAGSIVQRCQHKPLDDFRTCAEVSNRPDVVEFRDVKTRLLQDYRSWPPPSLQKKTGRPRKTGLGCWQPLLISLGWTAWGLKLELNSKVTSAVEQHGSIYQPVTARVAKEDIKHVRLARGQEIACPPKELSSSSTLILTCFTLSTKKLHRPLARAIHTIHYIKFALNSFVFRLWLPPWWVDSKPLSGDVFNFMSDMNPVNYLFFRSLIPLLRC